MNIHDIRTQFPILAKPVYGNKRLAYLDSAATSQKPHCVIHALSQYYTEINSNVHRGIYYLSNAATEAFEETRATVQRFINAKEAKECIFTRGTTDAINLIAHSFGEHSLSEDDEILISILEHHSNIVPWQMVCQRKKAKLKAIPINPQGELDLTTLDELLTPKTKLLAITHVSNALGTINPIKDIIRRAHAKGIPVLVDGAQAVPHLPLDVQDLDCDFYTFSSHKLYGPTGVGILYGKTKWLEQLPPYQGGGEMILKVTLTESTYNELPYKFEAGTPPIAAVVAFKTALDFFMSFNRDDIIQHETQLLNATTDMLSTFPDTSIIGTATEKTGVVSFTFQNIHPHDIGTIADQHGVALRTGHHCAMPTMEYFGISATTRASFGMYNTLQDVEQLALALKEVLKVFRGRPLKRGPKNGGKTPTLQHPHGKR